MKKYIMFKNSGLFIIRKFHEVLALEVTQKEDKIYELKKKLQALEWDIKYNKLPLERVTYYNLLLKEYNDMRGIKESTGEVKNETL